jgi:hypothetical protein
MRTAPCKEAVRFAIETVTGMRTYVFVCVQRLAPPDNKSHYHRSCEMALEPEGSRIRDLCDGAYIKPFLHVVNPSCSRFLMMVRATEVDYII